MADEERVNPAEDPEAALGALAEAHRPESPARRRRLARAALYGFRDARRSARIGLGVAAAALLVAIGGERVRAHPRGRWRRRPRRRVGCRDRRHRRPRASGHDLRPRARARAARDAASGDKLDLTVIAGPGGREQTVAVEFD